MRVRVGRARAAGVRASAATAFGLMALLGPGPASADQNLDILYVNRCTGGCQVRPGSDNAINNTSSLVTGIRTVPAFPFVDAVFDGTVTCLRSVFAPYDVIVTTADPGAVPHRELMLGGLPSAIGQPSNVAGVAPFNGSPLNNVIAFAFAVAIGGDVDELCYNAGHELGHLYGLDHEFYCPDLMTYLQCAGTKTFSDFDAPCGEGAERACVLGADTQNSHTVLAAVAGQEEIVLRNGFEEAGPVFEDPAAAARSVEPLVCGTTAP
jgi:hypothetical protein